MYLTYYDLSKKTLEVMERAYISDEMVDALEREIQLNGRKQSQKFGDIFSCAEIRYAIRASLESE